ncbi:MAG: PRC-barrel domain-containing protein [Geminicoccaceae bacterium]
MAGSRWHRLLVASSAILVASAVGGNAQQQRETPGELVQPEVRQEAPPLLVGPAGEPEEQNPEQLMTSLRRAEEALQLDDRKAAMQALIQAEEQLDQVADDLDTPPWQRFDLALQDAMKALAEDNPKYALTALQRVTGPAEGSAAAGSQAGAEQGEQQTDTVLGTVSASDVIGAEVVDARGEKIAEVSDIVQARDGGELYAILDVGGFLGMGDKVVALALDQFQVAEDDQIVLPQATESQLEEMPVYNEEDYEQLR